MRRSITRGVTMMTAVAGLALAAGCATSTQQAARQGEFQEGASGTGRPIATRPAPGLETVYFDYDKATIRGDARSALRGNADVIQDENWSEVVLEGHADERGSEEYNLALGERRATSVKRYLMNLGVPGSKMTVVSYGESRPAKPGHDESAWRYNRRVEFGLPR